MGQFSAVTVSAVSASNAHRAGFRPAWPHLIVLGLILLLAAFLRLNRLDLIDFRFDQAYPLQYAQDIVRGYLWGVQPHGSVASHPAAYLYVMALPYLVTRNFMTVVTYRVLLDVAAVGLTWLIGARYFNKRVGLIASLLFAVAPWGIQFARNMWPVPQPLFSAVLLIGLLEIVQRRNPWGWALSGLGIALVAGAHLGGVYVLPVALVAFVIGRKSFKLGPALLGLLPIALVAAAYLIHDAVRGFENLHTYLGAVGGGARFSADVLQFTAWLSGGTGLGSLTGQSSAAWVAGTPGWSPLLDGLQVAWLAASGIWVAVRVAQRRNLSALIVLAWLAIPIALQLVSSRPVMLQYLPVLLPAPFLLMALALDNWLTLVASSSRAVKMVAAGAAAMLVCAITLGQVATTLRFTTFVDANNTQGGYALPVRSALAARQGAADALASGHTSGDVIAVIKDFPTPWNEQAAILRAVLADLPYRFLNSEGDGFVYRPEGTHYIFAPGTEAMLNKVLAHAPAGAVISQSVETQPGSGLRYVYLQVRGPMDTDGFADAPRAMWENGVQLAGYRIQRQDGQVAIETVLRVTQTPPDGADYHWFNHVLAGEDKVAQTDGAGVHPSSWQAGDLIMQAFTVALPDPLPGASQSAPLQVRIGSYTWPDVQGVAVAQDGKPDDNGITLPVP
jgi:hypothetical protein